MSAQEQKGIFSSEATIKVDDDEVLLHAREKAKKAAGRQRRSSKKAESSGKGKQKSKSQIKIETKVWHSSPSLIVKDSVYSLVTGGKGEGKRYNGIDEVTETQKNNEWSSKYANYAKFQI